MVVLTQKYISPKFNVRSINLNLLLTIFMFLIILSSFPYTLLVMGGVNLGTLLMFGLLFGLTSQYIGFNRFKMLPSSPMIMIPLIIIIEVIRYLIRPLSLILRVAINLSIGHILIYMLIFPFRSVYTLIEFFVYTIQMYIF